MNSWCQARASSSRPNDSRELFTRRHSNEQVRGRRSYAGVDCCGMSESYPTRIVCLTEETTETLYLLGQGHRIVGVSGYTVRPPEARRKPKVSAFINARFDKIEALQPDLVLAFSDLQAEIGAELVRRGIAVVTFNQRTVAE